jgi:hypothetical protein
MMMSEECETRLQLSLTIIESPVSSVYSRRTSDSEPVSVT